MVSTFNAQYKPGLVDGAAHQARFRSPTAVVEIPLEAFEPREDMQLKDSDGRGAASAVVVADTQNNVLRVAIISHSAAGGKGSYVKKFATSGVWMRPRGMCCVSDGMLVCDAGHHRIRSVSFDGRRVVPFAGCGKKGHKDGPVDKAMFDNPSSVCVCPTDGSVPAPLSHTMHSSNGFRKSTSPQNRQLIVSISNCKQPVDNFVGELTF
jgi:hypothetical protein